MKRTLPGEIWRVDFGLAAKVRPALILSDYPREQFPVRDIFWLQEHSTRNFIH